jgi:hypothetical protein
VANEIETKPGWYIAYDHLGVLTCIYRIPESVSILVAGQLIKYPEGWTFGPRIDDLLGDVARLEWLMKSYMVMAAVSPNAWLLAKTPDEKRALIDAEIAREKSHGG